MHARVMAFFAMWMTIVAASPCVAKTWYLHGVSFSDGGTAQGHFERDPVSGSISAWRIVIKGGDETTFPPRTLVPANSSVGGSGGGAFFFEEDGTNRQLRFAPNVPLPPEGGEVPLDIAGNPNGNVECFNCSPFRLITSGSLSTAPISWHLIGVSMADGGTASGSFTFDEATSQIVDWSLSISGGNTGTFPPIFLSPANSTASFLASDRFLFQQTGTAREFRMSSASPLTGSGGSVDLNVSGDPNFNVECFNCSPFRPIVAGALDSPPMTWHLQNISFSDGGVAEGTFTYNEAISSVVDWSISISGGDESTFPPITLEPANSTASSSDGGQFRFQLNGSTRELRIDPTMGLTNDAASVPVDLGNPNFNVECFNCTPFRSIESGTLVNPLAWHLVGVTFEDGGTASGRFYSEESTSPPLDWSIPIAGGDETTFPPIILIPANSSAGPSGFGDFDFADLLGSTRELRLDPIVSLTNDGGSIPVDLANQNGNVECFNCNPFRLIDAGDFVALPEPPPRLGLFAAVAGLGVLAAHRRAARRRRAA